MKKKAVKLLSAALSIALILGVSGTAHAIETNTRFEIAVIKDGVEAAVLDVGDTIEVSINIVNTSDREMKYAATQCGIQYDTDYFSISGEPVSPIGGTAVSKPNEGTVRMGRFGMELSLVDGYSTILTFALIVKAVPAGATAISLSDGIIGDFYGLPILENATASTDLTINNPAPSPEPDTVTVTTADELNAAVYGVIDTGKSLEIRVEGTVPVDELYIQGCSITLTGGGTLERKSTESAQITILTADDKSSSLTLRDITLDGKELTGQGEGAVNAAMVLVHDGGALVIEDGTILENNHCGSAVLAESGATVTMTGGTIRNNIAPQGAGLHIAAATAVMSGGTISGNTAAPAGMGGGVYVGGTNGSFRMEGGAISGNTALKELVEGQGGGVYVDTNATFTMTSGEIKNNVSQDSALTGIGVYNLGTFTMSGGMISGNVPGEAPAGARAIVGMGGGVYTQGNFTMSGGSITGNKGAFSGGVIYDGASLGGNFTLSGEARISGNTDAILNESADISLNRGRIQVVGALSAADTMAVYPYDYNSSGRGTIARGAEGYTLTQTDADKFLPFAGGWGYGFEYANDTLQFVTEKSGAVLPYPYAGVPAGAYKDTISNINLHTDTEDAEIYYQVVNEWPSGPIDPAVFCTEEKKYTGGSTIEISNESPYSMLMLCAKKGEEYSDVGVNQYAFPRIVDMWGSPAGVTALKGDRVAFTGGANCEGGRVRTELSWSVEGATSGDTAIDRFGVLTVGADEAATSLTVKLTDSVFGAVGTATARMKASTVVSATQPNGVYGQALPELTKAAENEGTNGVWWILYSGTEDTEYEISEIKPTAAGKYIVIVDYSSDEYKGYAVAPFVIEKAPLTAKPTDKSIYVGDALPTDFALTYTGLANGDTTAVLTVSGTPEYALKNGETSLENSNTAGDYTIAWSNKEAVEIAADNYTVTKGDGTLTILPRASTGDGGNGGGGAPKPPKPPKPTENLDGSQTTTETDKKTGTVTETTKRPDGSQTVVDTKKDGTVSTTDTRKDGVKADTVTTPEGNTTATVTVPKDVPKVTVTIPTPEKPKPGEVAVIINADGTKTVVKNSVATEDGMTITLAEGAKLEIIDNSKTFSDVKGSEWYANAVQFAASRELLQGNGTGFAPREHMTRGMLMTVLYRFEGASVSSGGDKWYSDALAWSKEQNLSDGTNPEGDISREQLAVILYRYAGSPKAEDTATDFADSGDVSAWAAEAMDWAVSAGLLRGGDGGKLNPQGNATRAEVAAILQRFISSNL